MDQNQKVDEPIPISKVAGRYLLFDINVVTHLRRNHNILGVLTGTIPTCPQQNLFTGLPLQLLPEEARILVMKGVAYAVDDLAFHKQRFNSFGGEDRRLYLQSLRSEGRKAQLISEKKSAAGAERHLTRQAALVASETSSTSSPVINRSTPRSTSDNMNDRDDNLLFDGGRSASPALSSNTLSSKAVYQLQPVTLSTTYPPVALPPKTLNPSLPDVPIYFPLFAHLHEKGYFMSPGLRFGCHYSVYPGDPLRYHAHFLGVGYEWDQEIPLMDIVGGGRLAGGVKKGYLMGGQDPSDPDGFGGVRTFCVEWGGM